MPFHSSTSRYLGYRRLHGPSVLGGLDDSFPTPSHTFVGSYDLPTSPESFPLHPLGKISSGRQTLVALSPTGETEPGTRPRRMGKKQRRQRCRIRVVTIEEGEQVDRQTSPARLPSSAARGCPATYGPRGNSPKKRSDKPGVGVAPRHSWLAPHVVQKRSSVLV